MSTPIGERDQSVVMALLGKEKVFIYNKGARTTIGEVSKWNKSLHYPHVFFINENVADYILGMIALSGEPINKLTNYKVIGHSEHFITAVDLDITKLTPTLNRIPKWDLPLASVFNYMIVKEDFTCV